MPVLNWPAAVASLGADPSPFANKLRQRLVTLAAFYTQLGSPSLLDETSDHAAWRQGYAVQLATLDRAAASVDGKPLTPISAADPKAAAASVIDRVASAIRSGGTTPAATFLGALRGSGLESEPPFYIDRAMPSALSISGALASGTRGAALITTFVQLGTELADAIDQAQRYVAARYSPVV